MADSNATPGSDTSVAPLPERREPVFGEPVFGEPAAPRAFPATAVGIAAAALLILAAVLVLLGRRHGGSTTEGASYASSLALTGITPSRSESLAGGQSTYVDGTIRNVGPFTVVDVTVEATFAVDGPAPQVLNAPLQLIRTREPYVDTQALTAAPLAPGGAAEFRLIFEGVNENWNQQQPSLRIIGVRTR